MLATHNNRSNQHHRQAHEAGPTGAAAPYSAGIQFMSKTPAVTTVWSSRSRCHSSSAPASTGKSDTVLARFCWCSYLACSYSVLVEKKAQQLLGVQSEL